MDDPKIKATFEDKFGTHSLFITLSVSELTSLESVLVHWPWEASQAATAAAAAVGASEAFPPVEGAAAAEALNSAEGAQWTAVVL